MLGDVELNLGFVYEYVFDIIYLNIRSIRYKFDFLNIFLYDFDIVCFIEIYLDDSILDEELEFDGFNFIYCKDRNFFGGGVIINLLNVVCVCRCVDFELNNVECIWLEIEEFICRYFLCCFYCLFYINFIFWNNFLWFLDKVNEIFDKIIIVGDVNVDFLNILNIYEMCDILFINNFINRIFELMRIMNIM